MRHEKHVCVCGCGCVVRAQEGVCVCVYVRSLSDICIPLWSGLGWGVGWNRPMGNKQETDR